MDNKTEILLTEYLESWDRKRRQNNTQLVPTRPTIPEGWNELWEQAKGEGLVSYETYDPKTAPRQPLGSSYPPNY